MSSLWSVAAVLVALCVSMAQAGAPGAVAFWQASGRGGSGGADAAASGAGARVTNTKTQDSASLSAYLTGRLTSASASAAPEAVVVLTTSDGRASLAHSSVSTLLLQEQQAGESVVVMPAVYAATEGAKEGTKAAILGAVATAAKSSVQKLSLGEFLTRVREPDASKNPLQNNKLDAFEVVLTGHESEQALMKELSSSVASSNTLVVAMQEPTATAPKTIAHYSRILASKSSNIIDGIYYKPEGAEYSIYYADTYLYLTPDIFTGLLSGFFFLATALIGVSCMNNIQGPTSFSHKENVPAIGREN